ncbi:MAG: ArnT family glycosyltransferase [Wenzhouxiangellaceae bacterium]
MTKVHPRPLVVVLLLAAFLLLPSMGSVGMFMDGTIYAAISRNLADGLGSPWALHFSEGLFPVFREHPPLMFWLQSLFFRLLGDSYLTERAYDLVVVLTTAVLIVVLWRKLVAACRRDALAAFWWLPLLLWVVVPKWAWTYRNNMLESTLTVFCLAAVLLVLAGLRSADTRGVIFRTMVAALATLLAFLAKGPVALFVLAAPFLLGPAVTGVYWRRTALVTVTLVVGFAVLLAFLLAWPDAHEMLAAYWHKQVVGRSGISSNDAGLLIELAKKLAAMLLVLAGLRIWIARNGGAGGWLRPVTAPVLAMLALGLAASLPLLLGDLDSAHYLVPALPFFAIGVGLVGASMLDCAEEPFRQALDARPGKAFVAVSVACALAILALSLSRIGDVRKNDEYHVFLAQVAEVTGEPTTIAVAPSLYRDWYMHAIAMRHYHIGLESNELNAFWLLRPADADVLPGYRATGIRNESWRLWRRDAE